MKQSNYMPEKEFDKKAIVDIFSSSAASFGIPLGTADDKIFKKHKIKSKINGDVLF